MVIYQKMIFRTDLKNNPNVIYLFGDNLKRYGMGGQAKEMRGEPNAIGIRTKYKPTMEDDAFFTDEYLEDNKRLICNDFHKIPEGKIVIIPSDGIGTGLAMLDTKAPLTFEYIQMKIEELKN